MSVEALGEKHICNLCIAENYLNSQIEANGSIVECDYCGGEEDPAVQLREVANQVEVVFDNHFERTPAEPNWYEEQLLKDKETDFDWWREGQPTTEVIAEVASVQEDVAIDLQKILHERHSSYDEYYEEAEFDSDAHYWEKPADYSDIWDEWRRFERELKTETRYFSPHATEFLKTIFEGLADLKTRNEKPLIVEAGPELDVNGFFRARYFETDEAIKRAMMNPERELAPPPTGIASAGRMNSRGVTAFYGANLPDAALAEVRPPVGSQVLVAKFNLIRKVKLLDLSSLTQIGISGSYFDPKFLPLLKRTKFLADLATMMSQPVMPNDADLDYLPTQVISDYLSRAADTPIDGILFPSVQTDAGGDEQENKIKFVNVVLFNRSSRVAQIEYPRGTEKDAKTWQMYNEGPEVEYQVTIRSPKEDKIQTEENQTAVALNDVAMDLEESEAVADVRENTLEVDVSFLSVHIVKAVRILTEPHSVDWFAYTEPDKDVL